MGEPEEEIAALKARLASLEKAAPEKKALGARRAAIGCAAIVVGVILIAIAAATCSGHDATTTAAATSPPAPEPAAEPVAPRHGWSYRDGQEYGYQGELSDDDKKAGRAAAEVLMFRYLGERDGIYTVEQVSNGVRYRASCANPCEVVKLVAITPYGSSSQRLAFNESSIIGSALTDAFNGQMDAYRPGTAPAP